MTSISHNSMMVDGVRYNLPPCKSMSIVNGKVYLDGKEYKPTGLPETSTKIEFHNCTFESVDVKDIGLIEIKESSVGPIRASAGNVTVHGDVSGSVTTSAGNVKCADIGGNVVVSAGNVTAEDVHGHVDVKMGNVTHRSKRESPSSSTPTTSSKRQQVTTLPSSSSRGGIIIGSNVFGTNIIRSTVMSSGTPVHIGDFSLPPPPPPSSLPTLENPDIKKEKK